MKIPQTKIDEIASATDIVELISHYTALKKAGQNFMGRCPFHHERTPSFSISQEKGVYHCFGCGKSGNVFTFIMDIDNVSFFDAVKQLAERANIKIIYSDDESDSDFNKIEILYEINKKTAKIFYENLYSRQGAYAREYLINRNITEELITKFGLGFSLGERQNIIEHLSSDYPLSDIYEAGLLIKIKEDEFIDRFRGRIMFPIFSESGRVVAFGGRALSETGSSEAKYINSSETAIYNKSKILYGLNFTKKNIKSKGYALLVEGYFDLIRLYQNDFNNVIATSGTALTPHQIKILSRYTSEIVVTYDADVAGQTASRRAIELILENGLNCKLVVLPVGEDPDSYISNHGAEAFQRLIDKRETLIDYISHRYERENKLDSPEGKTEFVKEIISIISKIKNELKREFYIKDIAERFSIYENIIRKELLSYGKLKSQGLTREIDVISDEQFNKDKPEIKYHQNELLLIRLLVDGDKETKNYLFENLEADMLSTSAIIKIVDYIFSNIDKPEKITAVALYNEFLNDTFNAVIGKALMDENYILSQKRNSYIPEAKNIIRTLHINKLDKQINAISERIKKMNSDSPELLNLLKEVKELKEEKIRLQKFK